jgi:beta-glucosidase
MTTLVSIKSDQSNNIETKVADLISKMGLDEKIGQMSQLQGGGGSVPNYLAESLRSSRVGSILNEVNVDVINEMQRICVEESRLGIPLLIGRDVIHGFKTIFPIPLGQAASWDPEIIEAGARVSANEAASVGVNWTFAPMIDITRDPRWGRIAESLGEDPYLCGVLGAALVMGLPKAVATITPRIFLKTKCAMSTCVHLKRWQMLVWLLLCRRFAISMVCPLLAMHG